MVNEIKEEEWEKITSEKGKVLVDCFATWCGPCKMMSPIMDAVAEENDTCKFYKLDVDQAEEVAMQYGINAIPTLLFFEDGNLKKQKVGLTSKEEIEAMINE